MASTWRVPLLTRRTWCRFSAPEVKATSLPLRGSITRSTPRSQKANVPPSKSFP